MVKELEKNRAYKAANKPKIRLQGKVDKAARRARMRCAAGSFSKQDVANLMMLQKGRCPVCRCSLGRSYHVDHVQPLAAGGTNHKENLQLLCAPCNKSKSARDPLVFMRARGYLL
jgi:5-methylcytosine-specific restriction endonuclease McrA